MREVSVGLMKKFDGYPNEQGLDQGDRGAYASVVIDDA